MPCRTPDTTADLQYLATNSLTLGGATIEDLYGNTADLTLPGFASGNSLGELKDIEIDTDEPTMTIANITDSYADTKTKTIQVTGACSTDVATITTSGISSRVDTDVDC